MRPEIIDTRSKHRAVFPMLLVIILVAISGFAGAQEPPTFAATLDNQLGLTFSPDGKTAYWVEWDGTWGSRNRGQRVIYTAQQENGIWSKPEPAPLSQRYSNEDPFVSPDGQWLYFVSDRPINDADKKLDANIWRYSLVKNNCVEYLSINSESAEYSPVMTSSGALYFASARGGGPGEGDIYRAAPLGDGFGTVEILGPAINSRTGEWNLWVSADECELIFEASSRPTNVSASGDLYYSWRAPAGWTAAVPIERLNSDGSDLMPRLHPDGNTLYYTTASIGGHARIAMTRWGRSSTELREACADHDISKAPIRGRVIFD